MRTPRLDLATLRRGLGKVRQWLAPGATPQELPCNLRVLNPKMWPWFTRRHDRWLNRRLLRRQLVPQVRSLPEPPVAITTLPIVADLMDDLPVRRWVYYCVDDFSQWPGLDQTDAAANGRKVRPTSRRADRRQRNAAESPGQCMGSASHLLTHGVDLPILADSGSGADAQSCKGWSVR